MPYPAAESQGGEHFAKFIYYVRSNSIFEVRLIGGHVMRSILQRASSIDRILLLALAAGAAFTLNGIWWGWVECWNPDQMALRGLVRQGRGVLEPAGFLKPPFHTYLNFFLSVVPFKIVQTVVNRITGSVWNFNPAILWWSRVIQLGLFLGIIALAFRIVDRAATRTAARVVALFTATSAGIVLQAHFLTADIPVTFWMLASFFFAQKIALERRLANYIVAGALAGVATATKYNGLLVGIAIPIFHLFATRPSSLLRTCADKRLFAAVAAVVLGFVLANPYAALDFHAFTTDFAYNYATTAVYGNAVGSGYWKFLAAIPEIVGWPAAIAVAIALIYGLATLHSATKAEQATGVAALAIGALYFLKFGAPPRVEVRFVLPVVPFLLIAIAPSIARFACRFRGVARVLAAALLLYNGLASARVGVRFADDPRMAAQRWVAQNVPPGSNMESTKYSPEWNLFPGIRINDVRMPLVSGRNGAFAHKFGDPKMRRAVQERNPDTGLEWYRAATLAARNPEFLAVDSLYTVRFLDGDPGGYYKETATFFTELLAGSLGYHVVFDEGTVDAPSWLYPKEIEFVDNQIVILRKVEGS